MTGNWSGWVRRDMEGVVQSRSKVVQHVIEGERSEGIYWTVTTVQEQYSSFVSFFWAVSFKSVVELFSVPAFSYNHENMSCSIRKEDQHRMTRICEQKILAQTIKKNRYGRKKTKGKHKPRIARVQHPRAVQRRKVLQTVPRSRKASVQLVCFVTLEKSLALQ